MHPGKLVVIMEGNDETIPASDYSYCFKELLEKASKHKPYDLFNLALAYEYGIGTVIDQQKAMELYLKAKDGGHEYGQQYAQRLLEADKPKPPAIVKTQAIPKIAATGKEDSKKRVLLAVAATPEQEEETQALPQKLQKQLPAPSFKIKTPGNKASAKPQDKLSATAIGGELLEVMEVVPVVANVVKLDTMPIKLAVSTSSSEQASMPSQVTYEISKRTDMDVHVVFREFKPKTVPEHFDYFQGLSKGLFFLQLPASKKTVSKPQTKEQKFPLKQEESAEPSVTIEQTQYSEQAKSAIGRWGEDFVYHLLKEKYRIKYPAFIFTELKNGFKLIGSEQQIEVVWHNKENESYKSKDFTIKKNTGKAIKKYCIEVKTTTAGHEHIATLSRNEVAKILKYSKATTPGILRQYYILRVYNAGEDSPKIRKIKNPLSKIIDGELEVSALALKL